MARMISKYDSTVQHLRMGRRHIRLCERVAGAEKFAEAIQSQLANLREQEKKRKEAVEAKEDAYDIVLLCDTGLDNNIRTIFERVRQYDREYNSRILDMVFPDHGYSHIVRMSFLKETTEATKIRKKLEALEAGHELRQLAAALQQYIDASKTAWDDLQLVAAKLKALQTDEELAKMAVRQQYEHNYLDARKEFGSAKAESIFPKISRKPVTSSSEEPQIPDEEAIDNE